MPRLSQEERGRTPGTARQEEGWDESELAGHLCACDFRWNWIVQVGRPPMSREVVILTWVQRGPGAQGCRGFCGNKATLSGQGGRGPVQLLGHRPPSKKQHWKPPALGLQLALARGVWGSARGPEQGYDMDAISRKNRSRGQDEPIPEGGQGGERTKSQGMSMSPVSD